MEVRLLTEHRRDDAELRASALKMLAWNATIPESVQAAAKDGRVTLTGTVDHRVGFANSGGGLVFMDESDE